MKDGETTTTTTTQAVEMIDVSALFQEAAGALTMQDPVLCNPKSFNLQDAMAALELLDEKMDCCEVPLSQVSPLGAEIVEAGEEERKVFPRPAPLGLDDVVDPLPWDDLTIQQSAFICLKNLVRLDSLLSGASLVESIYTCLFAHAPVITEMKARLVSLSKPEGADGDESPAQCVVYASVILMLELSEVFRSIILNADIYEEEDFTVNTYNIQTFDYHDDNSITQITKKVINKLKTGMKSSSDHPNDEIQICVHILEYQLDLLDSCTSLVRLCAGS